MPYSVCDQKGWMNVVRNEKNELVQITLVTGWRVCMHYRKLNTWTGKDHFPIPFMNKMFGRLAETMWYCFLDG